MDQERLLERFLQYVQIETTADERATDYPSSQGQFALGRLLAHQLSQLGLEGVEQDEHGLVWATIPATVPREIPTIAWNAHLDTSPETSGANVRPQVVRNYAGGDIVLPGDPQRVIRVEDNPALTGLLGQTLVTTDGTTLLGGDDKAGVAVIVETAACLMAHPEIPHGPIRVLFTCDEEIGRGIQHVDLQKLGAIAAYTLDGEGTGNIDCETFSADLALITVRGVNIHPSIAKGRMVNALRAVAELLERLPRDRLAPEVTAGREGFLHPYQLRADVAEATLRVLLRDFETPRLQEYAESIRQAAREVEHAFPGAAITVEVKRQYRNMRDGLQRDPRAMEMARRAFQRLGRPFRESSVRGGTDGAMLTELGLPTPNLSTGQHNPHSPLEWVCLEEMRQAAEVLVELARVWTESDASR